ncbi:hypothetical protein QT327_23385 [Olivibacter sp. 47]|uniref:hypothetical protein n=1 Tax=Olivibacter sp. 47 TaxID=3056486 RepID=UPI0025A407EA|nr:hypothetical protein [Olivibacter sp. 47]MDM8177257.1 hypothetical protein [Olivibacter sp. 47]
MDYFVFSYLGKPIGGSGENYGTVYDMKESCDRCGTGAKVKDVLKIKLKQTSKDLFETVDGDILISQDLYRRINDANLDVESLTKVRNQKGEVLPFYHLKTNRTLPPANIISGLKIEDQCPVCMRDGYFHDVIIGNLEKDISTKVIPLIIRYQKGIMDNYGPSDIFFSWECLGLSSRSKDNGGIIRYARPLLIVSERLKSVLENTSKKDIEFQKVGLI